MWLEVLAAVLIRILVAGTAIKTWLEDRVEISTPVTAWKRVEEGLALKNLDLNPYTGDIVHETPLLLSFYELIYPFADFVFIILDITTAVLLKHAVDKIHLQMVKDEQATVCHPSFESIKMILQPRIGYYALMVFLFNPYSIVLSATKSTQCTINLLYGLAIYGIGEGSMVVVAVATALASYTSLFPAMLLVPSLVHKRDKALTGILIFGVVFGACHGLSWWITGGSWDYVSAVYGFTLGVPDYTPNIGAAWYFFSEMFSHFTVLFLSVYQVNLILYALPLSLTFPGRTPLVTLSLLLILAMFKPYTCIGDYLVPFALLPAWLHLFRFLNHFYVVATATVVLTLLWPVLWYLWVHCLNANSNFYFAITLAFVLFQSFLLSDLLFAEMRREHAREHGTQKKIIDGKDSVVTLN